MPASGAATRSAGLTLAWKPSLRRPWAAWAPPLIYLVLALSICVHLLADPMHHVVAGNPHDVALISYFLQAEPTALLHGHNPLLITTLNAPDGVNVMWNTGLLLPAMVLAPISLTLGGTVTFNLLLVAGLAGSAWSAYWLARRFTRLRVSAFIAGLLYGFSPAITHQAVGHLHLVVAFLLPLLLGTLLDVIRGPFRMVTSVRLGLLAAAQLLTGEELFACAAVAGAVICLILAASRPRTAIRSARTWLQGLSVAAATFAVLTFVPLLFQLHGPRQQYGSPFSFDYYKTDLAWFVRPDRWMPLHRLASGLTESQLAAGNTEHDAFLGWPLLLFALWFLVSHWNDLKVRVVGGTAVVLGVFSLGSMLRADGTWTHLHLPWSYVQEQLPLMDGLLPERFGILIAGLVGLLVAFGSDQLLERIPSRPVQRLVLLISALVLLAPLTPRPLAAEARPATPAFIASGLSHSYLPSGTTVLALPFPRPTQTTAMDWQADDGLRWSMPGGYFVGPGCTGRDCRSKAVISPNLTQTATLLERVEKGALTPQEITPDQVEQAAVDLRHWGVSVAMVGPAPDQKTLVDAVTVLLGRPGVKVDDVYLWYLPK